MINTNMTNYLLLELYSEELPAKFQQIAESNFAKHISDRLAKYGINYKSISLFSSPCRISVHIEGLDLQKDQLIQIKGPRISKETVTDKDLLSKFCYSHGIKSEDVKIVQIKGHDYYVYEKFDVNDIENVLIKSLGEAIFTYKWPYTMRWGSYNLQWGRPLKNILCLYNGVVLQLKFGHLEANNCTFGHKFLFGEKYPFIVNNFQDYLATLEQNYVIASRGIRLQKMMKQIEEICLEEKVILENGSDVVLNEIVGLVEYPEIAMGTVPQKFFNLPDEMIVTVMNKHQRYLAVRKSDNKKLFHKFIFFINVPNPTKEHQLNIISDNEMVLEARLADGSYFYNRDLKESLYQRVSQLNKVVFHSKIGTLRNKVDRLVLLASFLEPENLILKIAAFLAKSDLVSETVREFPELQGKMSLYYELYDSTDSNLGLETEIASHLKMIKPQEANEIKNAIADHYLPRGLEDIPSLGTAAKLSILDKIDSLVGLFLVGEVASGSKDPYGLRRNALGVVKTILHNTLAIDLESLINYSIGLYQNSFELQDVNKSDAQKIGAFIYERFNNLILQTPLSTLYGSIDLSNQNGLKDLYKLSLKANALEGFINSHAGKKLLLVHNRILNILKDQLGDSYEWPEFIASIAAEQLHNPADKLFYEVLININLELKDLQQNLINSYEKYSRLLDILGNMSAQIETFFENVLINDPNPVIANNRRWLLRAVLMNLKIFTNS